MFFRIGFRSNLLSNEVFQFNSKDNKLIANICKVNRRNKVWGISTKYPGNCAIKWQGKFTRKLISKEILCNYKQQQQQQKYLN